MLHEYQEPAAPAYRVITDHPAYQDWRHWRRVFGPEPAAGMPVLADGTPVYSWAVCPNCDAGYITVETETGPGTEVCDVCRGQGGWWTGR